MAALRGEYDDYNRSWPKVFVGEYAARDKNHRSAAPLRSANADASTTSALRSRPRRKAASAIAERSVTTI